MSIPITLQKLQPGPIERHRHEVGYATIVLEGAYEESGDGGRRLLQAGDAVVHGSFEAHKDAIHRSGARVLNLNKPNLPTGFYCVADADAVLGLVASNNMSEALRLFSLQALPDQVRCNDWPDLLAAAIEATPWLNLTAWAAMQELRPSMVSDGFTKAYGVTPKRFRAESKARRAHCLIRSTGDPLAAIAVDCGFVDQAHMSRAVSSLTGRTPGTWRAAEPTLSSLRLGKLQPS